MEISLTPDTYSPNVNSDGNYVDHTPVIKHGIYCLCGSRQDKVYSSASKFSAHIKTQRHQKWLVDVNNNKANFFIEDEKNKVLINNQRKIIAQLENKIQIKIVIIECLTKQISGGK
jgi:hypothetical protein